VCNLGRQQRRLLQTGTSLAGLDEGRKAIQDALGATLPGASPFRQTMVKYGGMDTITSVMQLREQALAEEEAKRQAEALGVSTGGGGDGDSVASPTMLLGDSSILPSIASPQSSKPGSSAGKSRLKTYESACYPRRCACARC
jgi:hypothetical protein